MDKLNNFCEDLIVLGLHAKTCDEVIAALGRQMEASGCVKDTFTAAAMAREKEFATGLPLGTLNVALPHTDSIHVNEQRIAVGILDEPVEFHVMGCPDQLVPVHVVFLMAIKKQHDQVFVLQRLAEVIQEPSFIESLYASKSPSEALNILSCKFGMELTHGSN